MGADSKIEWCHATFNMWRGCTKVSAGCARCYAEQMSKRNPATLGVWGDGGTRVVAGEKYWSQAETWNREALFAGERRRVFCASLADWLEDRPELDAPRKRLVQLIPTLHHLDWLLLSKRLHLAEDLFRRIGVNLRDFLALPNVWLGTSVEDQAAADSRIPVLLQLPARVRFLSMEPLLGPVDLRRYLSPVVDEALDCPPGPEREANKGRWPGINWIIVGGESGPGARPMHPDWARSLRDQCQAAGVAYFFKQWGEWVGSDHDVARDHPTPHGKMQEAGKVHVWPYKKPPGPPHFGMDFNLRVGKAEAGRLFDGRTWDEFPITHPERTNANG